MNRLPCHRDFHILVAHRRKYEDSIGRNRNRIDTVGIRHSSDHGALQLYGRKRHRFSCRRILDSSCYGQVLGECRRGDSHKQNCKKKF